MFQTPLKKRSSELEKQQQNSNQDAEANHGMLPIDAVFLDGLQSLSGGKILEKVLGHPDCPRLIRSMSGEDFFFLIHKIGEDSSIELLKLASLDQWQYVLDVETWEKDRLELAQTGLWLRRLLAADPQRLTKWLFSEGQWLAYYYLYRSVVVEVADEDEGGDDFGPEFFSVDGFFYVRTLQETQRGVIDALLRTMAAEDTLKYQSVLTGLAGVLPAELEEDMYRMRNVRLAEHGFLPREEAIMVFSPMDAERLKTGEPDANPRPVSHPEDVGAVPHWPLQTIQERNLLTQTLSQMSDETLLDRIRLEFSGLCNQILSAEGFSNWNAEYLEEIQRQAAGYLNLILKERSREEIKTAENLLRFNTLVSLFRAGFGLAVKLKWKAERWLETSWFRKAGLEPSFWGEAWEGTLTGILKNRPLFYGGAESPGGYRHFQSLSDLSATENALALLNALDRLMASLTERYPLSLSSATISGGPFHLTVHQLLLTLWARQQMGLSPSFKPLSFKAARNFLTMLREGDTVPPYHMFGFEAQFLEAFSVPDEDFATGSSENLKDALMRIWQDFSDEMAFVRTEAFDTKYSKCILIRTA
ncbi:conserved hypothetical protein [delta proteobacterium NaphS2]|nr:conserved hypothetical protein [delta proteobacterium NaphS2]